MNKKRTKQIGRTKHLIFLLLAAVLLIVSNIEAIHFIAQADSTIVRKEPIVPNEDTPYEVVEQMPEYPGGVEALMKFISENIRYPKEAQESRVQGRVVVQFTVSKDGYVINPQIVRSVSPELDKEAIRVVSLIPKWKPGKQNGKM